MVRSNIRSAAVLEAQKVLKILKIGKAPIPIEKVAKHLGFVIRLAPLDDEISGMAFVKDGVPIIGVNSLHHPNRQRFTIAHEIGHLLLHREFIESKIHIDKQYGVLMRNATSSKGVDALEIEANKFAAELLMPKEIIEEVFSDEVVDVDDEELIEKLAGQFKVSRQAMSHRLSSLMFALS